MEQTQTEKKAFRGKRLLYAVAAILLAIHLALVISFARKSSATFDEIVHITGGYTYLTRGDCRFMDVVSLPDRVAALPLLCMDLRFPGAASIGWAQGNPIETGRAFFYEMGNDGKAMLFRSRLVMAITCLLPGVLVFFWSRSLFGDLAGLLSLALFAFEPLMLAHNGLAASDTYAAGLLLCCTGALWRLLHRAGIGTLLLSGLCLGLLAVTKVSGAMIVPMAAIMAAIRLASGRPWKIRIGREVEVKNRLGQAGLVLVFTLFLCLFVGAFIWGFYGFRYSAFSKSENLGGPVRVQWQEELAQNGAAGDLIGFARDRHLLPEGYLWMYAYVLRNSHQRRAFAMGKYSIVGWPWFFPFCFAVKTPLSVMALLLLALAVISAGKAPCPLYRLTPLAALFFVYWGFALTSHLNIGQRHLMPAYLVCYIMAGAVAGVIGKFSRTFLGMAAALAVLVAVESLSVYPYFLGFFNVAAGGPKNGYRLLTDSSLDWGQDLPALSRYLSENGLKDGRTPVYLSYFGTASPAAYGVNARALPSYEPLDAGEKDPELLVAGVYCISATQLWQVYEKPMGRWCQPMEQAYWQTARLFDAFRSVSSDPEKLEALYKKAGGKETLRENLRLFTELRLARLCAALRKREPDASAGYSILIYRVSQAELDSALSGPPAELFPNSGVEGA